MTTKRGNIKSVEIAFQVIQVLMKKNGARVTEVANELDIAPSTAHNHLQTLLNEGYVVNEGSIYVPSMEFLHIGEYARRRKPLFRKAESRVEALSEETGGRTHFIIEEHGRGRYVYTSTGHLAIETFSGNGTSLPLHVSAAGKAILAALPEGRVKEIIDWRGLEAKTERSITDEDKLFEELDAIRERGVAYNLQEHLEGINAVGAAVHEQSGEVLGALSISGPAQRLKGNFIREELRDTLLATVNELELDIIYS